MKEQSKTPQKELSNEDVANLSDGEFKALVIKMLTDLIELGRNCLLYTSDAADE